MKLPTTNRLSYCTNVHAASNLKGVLRQLDRFALPVRDKLGWDQLSLGLWLDADVADGLVKNRGSLKRLRRELDARGLRVYSLNAFPYRGFHDSVVKHAVYQPNWTDKLRYSYTVDCALILNELLPEEDDAVGSISTLPLGWREPWSMADDDAAINALSGIADLLRLLPPSRIRLAMEPEPGCLLDTVDDAIAWLRARFDPNHVGLCLDTCHLATSFADPSACLASIAAAGLEVFKVQASAAVHIDRPAEAGEALSAFHEPRYLHQVRERTADGTILSADDLPADELPKEGPWRVHYHVPLHWEPEPGSPVWPTTDVLESVLSSTDCPQIEVETYTWGVLPPAKRPATDAELVAGIAAELQWAESALARSRTPVA